MRESDEVKFPQPLRKAPEYGTRCWVPVADGGVLEFKWDGGGQDIAWLKSGHVYLNRSDAEQRWAWGQQQLEFVLIPEWFEELGPNVEYWLDSGRWVDVKADEDGGFSFWPTANHVVVKNWPQATIERFRAKPKPRPLVTHNINGKDYSWPEPANALDPSGTRYEVTMDRVVFLSGDSRVFGRSIHLTKDGALAHFEAVKALGFDK